MRRRPHGTAALAGVIALCLAGTVRAEVDRDARRLIDEGQRAEAVALLERETSEEQRTAEQWFLLATAYHGLIDEVGMLRKRGLAKKMKQALATALERDPGHVRARRQLTDYYHYAPWIAGGSEREAERHLKILERVDPGAAWETRGDHARSAGNLELARVHYRKALELGPSEPQRLLVLAVIEQQLEAYEESLRLLDELLALRPDEEKAHYYVARASALAALQLDRGLESARFYVDNCGQCDDEDRAFGWWRLATILKRQLKMAEAIAAYEKALSLNPDLKGARNGLRELQP